jgi:uncharacterized protein YkwD
MSARLLAIASIAGLTLAACVSSDIPPPAPVATDACAVTLPQTFAADVPNDGSHDNRLVSEATTAFVNERRCRAGLDPVTTDPALTRAAEMHSGDMAQLGFFDHRSPVAGRNSFLDRLDSAGARYGEARENILKDFFIAYKSGVEYRVISHQACTYTYGGRTGILPRHTYASLGQAMVEDWMASPNHRDNMLSPNVTRHGAAIAPTGGRELCGGLVATQLLVE